MDRNEILEKNKNATPPDEGMAFQENRARTIASTCMIGILALFVVYNLFKGLPSHSLQALLWAFIGIEAFVKYRFAKNKAFLVTAVAGILASVFSLATYIVQTW